MHIPALIFTRDLPRKKQQQDSPVCGCVNLWPFGRTNTVAMCTLRVSIEDSLSRVAGPWLTLGDRREPHGATEKQSSATLHMMTVQSTETELENVLPQIAAGADHSMDLLIDRYGGLIWSLARKACPTAQDAEDATQDILLEIWKSASRFDESVASETTFIATITRRRLIDRHRRRGRRIGTVQLSDGMDAAEMQSTDVSHASQDMVKAAMSQLSPEQQKVLELSLVYGLSHEKISRATGMPLGTVKTHARRGLIRARDLLKQQDSSEQDDGGSR